MNKEKITIEAEVFRFLLEKYAAEDTKKIKEQDDSVVSTNENKLNKKIDIVTELIASFMDQQGIYAIPLQKEIPVFNSAKKNVEERIQASVTKRNEKKIQSSYNFGIRENNYE